MRTGADSFASVVFALQALFEQAQWRDAAGLVAAVFPARLLKENRRRCVERRVYRERVASLMGVFFVWVLRGVSRLPPGPREGEGAGERHQKCGMSSASVSVDAYTHACSP